jgi:dUTP pyrophosphatase
VPRVDIVVLRPEAQVPQYAHPGDGGCDLVACEEVELAPAGGRAAVGCGIAIAIPEGYAGFVLPRSGLAIRAGVTCLNAPGLVDAGYRGELRVVLVNSDPREPFVVHVGDRIAQLVIQRVEHAAFEETETLPATARGVGGFGSTGVGAGADAPGPRGVGGGVDSP